MGEIAEIFLVFPVFFGQIKVLEWMGMNRMGWIWDAYGIDIYIYIYVCVCVWNGNGMEMDLMGMFYVLIFNLSIRLGKL